MRALHIITPVKDSIPSTIQTVNAIRNSKIGREYTYTIYNDFSSDENTATLEREVARWGDVELVNLKNITTHPSPNYLLVLQISQQRAIREDADLLIVESDVEVATDTVSRLVEEANEREDCGIAAAVTVDERGVVNYPYEYAAEYEKGVHAVKRHCSFCCSLLTNRLLRAFDFKELNPEKHWFDVTISQRSRALGFNNYLFTSQPVVHRPHASRPWKQLKYTNPLKYYWIKLTKGFDKI